VKKNYPIVRHGKLALLPDERIPFSDDHPENTKELYLADVMSFGGNSGSPVFLRLGGLREAGNTLEGYSYYLLGTMEGYYQAGSNIMMYSAGAAKPEEQNSGIAAIIPANAIEKLLTCPRAVAYRDRNVADADVIAGELEDAELLYKEAIRTLEISDPKHSDLAVALDSYARLLEKTKRHDEAQVLLQRAMKIRADINPDRLNPRS
jgi:tetratricopeptide (TPR) repeat protein